MPKGAFQVLERCVPSAGMVRSKRWNDAFQTLEWCIPNAGMVRSKCWKADYQALEVRLSGTCTGSVIY
jgi:hypothetical protein